MVDMRADDSANGLVLGPLLRYVDTTVATLWVEVAAAGAVTVTAGATVGCARTFAAYGHHYAVVDVEGLGAGTRTPYVVDVDGVRVWPEPDSPYPAPVIRTLEDGRPLRMAFGSCRVSVSHDEQGNSTYGVDALRAMALALAGITEAVDSFEGVDWPDLLLLLGDQVYADETSPAMQEVIEARRDPEQPPGLELKDFEEYTHLYRLAWSDPANRWLLSTLPAAMIFDDHDIRDDWNTSLDWRRDMEATEWWHDRVVGGLGAYWVYQHLGNLSPDERAGDELYRRVLEHQDGHELDLTEPLDALADLADREPDSIRWSFARTFGSQARLVVVDSRAARVLEPGSRAVLDDAELAWLDEQMTGDVDHLIVGTSLPVLMSPGLHHLESFNEAWSDGRLGSRTSGLGEWSRRLVDMEHWAAFQQSFRDVTGMALQVAAGQRGRAPASVIFLSGDVHHSYLAEAWPDPALGVEITSRVLQAVCSPIRNPLPSYMKVVMSLAARGSARPTGRLLGGVVPRSPIRWRTTVGPWYDNNLAMLALNGGDLRLWWTGGEIVDGDHERPTRRRIAEADVRQR